MFTNKNLFSNACKLVLALVLFTSCEPMVDKNLKSSKLELRQLVQETTTESKTTASFFLISGSYKSNTEEVITIKVFAKVEGRYRFIDIPIEKIRIVIDNELQKPTLEIEYFYREKATDTEVVDYFNHQSFKKLYIIYCPEQYLPEKLLPIGL